MNIEMKKEEVGSLKWTSVAVIKYQWLNTNET